MINDNATLLITSYGLNLFPIWDKTMPFLN